MRDKILLEGIQVPAALGVTAAERGLRRPVLLDLEVGRDLRSAGRTDDMLKIKGVMVYPAQIKDVVESFAPKTTGAFRILLDEPPPRVVPPVKLKIEFGKDLGAEDREQLKKDVEEKMHQAVKIRPAIEWIEPMSLERSDKKTQYIEKLYEK